MMKCEDIQQDLSEFIDNELSFDKNLIIKQHVDECEQCLNKVKSIKRLKQKLVSLDMTELTDDFNVKLQGRINKVNSKGHFQKLLPLAASIALIVPLVHYLTIKPPETVQNDFVVELLSVGNSVNSDYENFHKWTQLDDSHESLACANSLSSNYCSLDLSYVPISYHDGYEAN